MALAESVGETPALPKPAPKKHTAPARTSSTSFEQVFRNLENILRQEAGCTTELDYTEQTSWMLFLKYLDDLEAVRAMETVQTSRRKLPQIAPANKHA